MSRFAAFLLSLAIVPFSAWSADPPGRVGRLSHVEGEAAVYADPELGWESARVNLSLTSENSVWTEPGALAEVRFAGTALRLGETTQLDIVRLDDREFRGHLPRGTLAVRILGLDRGDAWTIGTPDARFQLTEKGRYRVDADPGRAESRLTVFSGSARLEVVGGAITVEAGRSVRVMGGERPRYEFEAAYSVSLDDWALARDHRFEEREAARYVPPEVTGWEDLDDYGVWRNEPEYGAVWFPTRVEVGWAPYRHGRWTWVRPWGWTWVDDAPWGYAPFHYGRWVYVGDRWGWYPGRYTSRPVWAPALVGWIGGSGWSVSISTGPASVLGWYPLSPYDNYQPWYSANTVYVTNVNRIVLPPRHDRDRRYDRRGDRRDDRNGYRHDNRDRGATVVPRDRFGSRGPVQGIVAPIPRETIAAQPVVPGASVLPTRNEWRSRVRPADAATPGFTPRAPAAPSAAPVIPAPAPAAPSRVVRPAPAEQTRPAPRPSARPAEPRDRFIDPVSPSRPGGFARPAPSQPVPQVQPAAPAQSAPAAQPQPVRKPVPVPSAAQPARTVPPAQPQPVVKPVPSPSAGQPARAAPFAQPVQKPAPSSQPIHKPAPSSQPAQRPAPAAQPQPVAKPGAAPERPARSADRPDKPGRSGDKD